MKLQARAPGKVNLCLFLGGTRDDGRHELVTVFESVSVADSVVLSTVDHGADEVVCPGVDGPNLAADALAALRARGWAGPPIRIEIEKRIPIAAGMAGGSADAAAVLRLATELAPGRPEEIGAIAEKLGADVPSQLTPGVVLGTGAGEIVEPMLALAPHAFVIVPLPFALSTADVYVEADRLGLGRPADELRGLEARLRAGELLDGNDLEPAAVSLCPEIEGVLAAARGAGADCAFVCGSGPTVAGLYWGPDSSARAQAAADLLAERFPGATAAAPVGAEFAFPLFA
jgi:4-diphosphocytidyl-2-C-methyl-D-erythritol kinase